MFFALNSSHFMPDYFLVEQSAFEFIKLSCNIYSFCCIRFFFLTFFCKTFLHSFLSYLCKYLQGPAEDEYHQAFFCKYLHLQYNTFAIYDEAKAVPQGPSHNKVPQKHVPNRHGSTSRRSMIPKKLLLCTFVEITLRHGCPRPL